MFSCYVYLLNFADVGHVRFERFVTTGNFCLNFSLDKFGINLFVRFIC